MMNYPHLDNTAILFICKTHLKKNKNKLQSLTWIIHKKWMKDKNMLKKKDFDDAASVAALRRGHRQRLYFEQIAVFLRKFMNYSI